MKIVATLPTYNESQNIADLIETILNLGPEYHAVVIDDNSPDKTWQIAENMAAEYPGRIVVIRRIGEKGRGTAGVRGFMEAIQFGADLIVEMDADWSHNPRFIPAMVTAADDAEVVIGSRLVQGGGEAGRNPWRKWITHGANIYIRTMLHLPVRDCTSGFRLFRRRALEAIHLDKLTSNGPAIVQEILMSCQAAGCRFVEVPILFEERRAGQSTFNSQIMLAGLLSVLKFRLRDWRKMVRKPASQKPEV